MMPSDGSCVQFLFIFVVVVLGNDIVCIKIRQKEEENTENVNKKGDTTLYYGFLVSQKGPALGREVKIKQKSDFYSEWFFFSFQKFFHHSNICYCGREHFQCNDIIEFEFRNRYRLLTVYTLQTPNTYWWLIINL